MDTAASTYILDLLVFLLVGAVVSLDVVGLTLCKSPKFADEKRPIWLWALLNGVWHAGLLLIYILIIEGIIDLSIFAIFELEKFIAWLRDILSFVNPDIFEYIIGILKTLVTNVQIILSLITFAIVWTIYSKKIIDVPAFGKKGKLANIGKGGFQSCRTIRCGCN